jgi:hypothetical protein
VEVKFEGRISLTQDCTICLGPAALMSARVDHRLRNTHMRAGCRSSRLIAFKTACISAKRDRIASGKSMPASCTKASASSALPSRTKCMAMAPSRMRRLRASAKYMCSKGSGGGGGIRLGRSITDEVGGEGSSGERSALNFCGPRMGLSRQAQRSSDRTLSTSLPSRLSAACHSLCVS